MNKQSRVPGVICLLPRPVASCTILFSEQAYSALMYDGGAYTPRYKKPRQSCDLFYSGRQNMAFLTLAIASITLICFDLLNAKTYGKPDVQNTTLSGKSVARQVFSVKS